MNKRFASNTGEVPSGFLQEEMVTSPMDLAEDDLPDQLLIVCDFTPNSLGMRMLSYIEGRVMASGEPSPDIILSRRSAQAERIVARINSTDDDHGFSFKERPKPVKERAWRQE